MILVNCRVAPPDGWSPHALFGEIIAAVASPKFRAKLERGTAGSITLPDDRKKEAGVGELELGRDLRAARKVSKRDQPPVLAVFAAPNLVRRSNGAAFLTMPSDSCIFSVDCS